MKLLTEVKFLASPHLADCSLDKSQTHAMPWNLAGRAVAFAFAALGAALLAAWCNALFHVSSIALMSTSGFDTR